MSLKVVGIDRIRHAFITSMLWLALVASAFGTSVEIVVAPKSLEHGDFVFAVAANSVSNGISFQITITSKTDAIPPDSGASVSEVKSTPNSRSITGVQPDTQVTLKKEEHVWTATFVASNELLKDPEACFVFTTYAHVILNGKSVAMPSATFYEFKLRDFLKQ